MIGTSDGGAVGFNVGAMVVVIDGVAEGVLLDLADGGLVGCLDEE